MRVFFSFSSEESDCLLVDGPPGSDRHEVDGNRCHSVDDPKSPDPYAPQAQQLCFQRLAVLRVEQYRLQSGLDLLLESRVEVSEQGADSIGSPEFPRRYGHLRRAPCAWA